MGQKCDMLKQWFSTRVLQNQRVLPVQSRDSARSCKNIMICAYIVIDVLIVTVDEEQNCLCTCTVYLQLIFL